MRADAKAPAAMYSTTGGAFGEMWTGQAVEQQTVISARAKFLLRIFPIPLVWLPSASLPDCVDTSCSDLKAHDNQITFLLYLMRIPDIFVS
jgi:hypothetical protein